ncbi:hypothetical protein CMQ_2164 [Grosmannia clavigera kw1407]|uniref:Uncharacterized protein n=1 Tax=Grosmannia clavigera (strain kw1407 / UAMH 11150) TaxID=655863 RepID=F0XJN8_GROCL|nr:uncharacterized protein CMQ_2164 [Grosmannia clavigera kw1407]EFX02115.1 hypothetical protein CMQ_2164 [Grosmannia clavigera kw1407]
MFLSSFAEQSWEDLVEWDLHYALYLAMQFGHDESFRMISRSLAVFCPPRNGSSSPALWAGKITEHFVHIAIVPVLQIKEAGEVDLDYVDPEAAEIRSECRFLTQLYEDLDDIVNSIEFSIYWF